MHSFSGISSAFDQLVLSLKKFIVQSLICFAYSGWFSASPIFIKGLHFLAPNRSHFIFFIWFIRGNRKE